MTSAQDEEGRGLERSVGSALLWLYVTQFAGKLLVFASVAILARLLMPSDFALVALVLAMLAFADALDYGIGSAIIYLDRADLERSASVAFTLHLLFSSTVAVGFNVAAPFLGQIGDDSSLRWIIHALSLHIVLRALGQTHENLLRRNLDFRSRLIPELASQLVKGVSSVVLALLGFGVWSLVVGQLLGGGVRTTLLWMKVPFRPKFDLGRGGVAGRLIRYGMPLLLSALIAAVETNFDYIVVGEAIGLAALGFYVIALRLPQLMFGEVFASLHAVLFPYYSRSREEGGDTRARYFVTVRLAALVAAPMTVTLTVLAEPVVAVVFGPGWEVAADVMPAVALALTIISISGLAGDFFKAEGRPVLLLWMNLVLVAVRLPTIFLAAPYGVVAVAWGYAACSLVWAAGFWFLTARVLSAGVVLHLRALLPALVAGGCAAGAAFLIVSVLSGGAALAVGLLTVAIICIGLGGLLSPEARGLLSVARGRLARA